METLVNLLDGFSYALTPVNLFYCFFGVALGTFVGVLPGIGSMAAISILLPITFYLEPTTALVMLAGIYYGGEYGGSTASILLRLPGSASSAVACLDGYPMAKQGRAGPALCMTSLASFAGGAVGIALMAACSPLLAQFALSFGPADYFAVMVLGLLASAAVTQGSPVKGVVMICLGVALGCVGTDTGSGLQRYTFGVPELFDGIDLVAIAMGLFGLSEVISSITQLRGGTVLAKVRLRDMVPTRKDVSNSVTPIARGSVIGCILGVLPGTGPTIAAFLSYAVEKRVSKTPKRFGHGAIEGVTAPEAANNAAAQTSFIPTLTLGIPGSATMALILGALMIHGITPGPNLMASHPEMFWGLVASFVIGNALLLLLNIPLIGLWVSLLRIPYSILYPAVIALICIGVYSLNYNTFDVLTVLVLGCAGYGMRLLGFEPAPLLMGFILGPLMEQYFRRAMLLSQGDVSVFIDRPISATVLFVSFAILVMVGVAKVRNRRKIAAVD